MNNFFLLFEQKKRDYVQRAHATTSTGRIKIDAPISFHLVKFKPTNKFSALNDLSDKGQK